MGGHGLGASPLFLLLDAAQRCTLATDMNDTPDNSAAEKVERPVSSGRRRFCQVAIGGTAVVSGATVAYPIVAFLRLPKSLGPMPMMAVPVEDLAEGYGYWGEHMGKQIVVVKLNDEIRAFDGTCTHLGCMVRWDSTSGGFQCPCHDAKFDDLGNPIAGPANTPLRRVEFVVEEGVLKIRDAAGRA
jgi:Rieske Fe-S protein